jgi:hypothetical protein
MLRRILNAVEFRRLVSPRLADTCKIPKGVTQTTHAAPGVAQVSGAELETV